MSHHVFLLVNRFVSILRSQGNESKGEESAADQVVVGKIELFCEDIPFVHQVEVACTCHNHGVPFELFLRVVLQVVNQILAD